MYIRLQSSGHVVMRVLASHQCGPGWNPEGDATDRLNLLKYSFSRFGARIWNSVPQSMRVLPEHKFKASLDQLALFTHFRIGGYFYVDTPTLIY